MRRCVRFNEPTLYTETYTRHIQMTYHVIKWEIITLDFLLQVRVGAGNIHTCVVEPTERIEYNNYIIDYDYPSREDSSYRIGQNAVT